jgi:hypothetical protein
MQSYKLYGLPGLDSQTDSGSAAAPVSQGGFGNAPSDSPSSGPGTTGPSTVPGSLTFISDDGGPPPTSNNAATTTQTVTFASSGLVFNNTYTGAVSAAYQSCVLSAEQALANICTNSVTINVEFDAEAEGQNGELASNEFWTVSESYTSLKSALTSLSSVEPNNTVLQQAVANLPTTDPSGGRGFALPLAYAQILGLSTETRSPEDIVTLNTSYNWSYGQDVVNTLEHEISEGGMGRIGGLGDQNSLWSTMDLFRYNAAGQPDYTDGRDGKTTFFSYNGGATLSTLSFNNEFNAQGVQVNGGDVADFTQQDVFGTGEPGETNTLSQTDIQMMEALGWNPPPPPATAEMIMQDSSNNYYLYDIGQNALQSPSTLGNLGSQTFGGIGNFGGDGGDLMLRDSSGNLKVYDISNNQITGTHNLGGVGAEWTIAGFGDFSGNAGETDMMMRSSSGALEVYDISNNQVTFATSLGNFGSNTVAGFGDFSGNAGETDMMMRNSAGALLIYDMGRNSVTSGPIDLGGVGSEWVVSGFGDFSGHANETDLIMRDTNNGDFELYDISDSRLMSAEALGGVGLEWTLAGFGDFSGKPGETDMLLRDVNSGAFEVYDIANNQIYSAASAGQVSLSDTVSGVGPNVAGSDTALSASGNADNGAAGPDASAGPELSDSGAASQQAFAINDFSPSTPSVDDFLQPAAVGETWSTPVSYGNTGTLDTASWLSQQATGATSGMSELTPPTSVYFAAPTPAAQVASPLPQAGDAAPLLGANSLLHNM